MLKIEYLKVGDRIMSTKNDPCLGLDKNNVFTVSHVSKTHFKLMGDDDQWNKDYLKFFKLKGGLDHNHRTSREVNLIISKHNNATQEQKHAKYKKPIPQDFNYLDVYRVCYIFGINDNTGAKHHAIKKLLCAGDRGYKDEEKDIQEVIDTLTEYLEIKKELQK